MYAFATLVRGRAFDEIPHSFSNDLVSLARILGHESLNTTARYTQRSAEQLAEAGEPLTY